MNRAPVADRAAALAGLAAAAALVAAVGMAMFLLWEWDGEVAAGAFLLALPLYVVARDAAARLPPQPPFVPPWERRLHGQGMRNVRAR